MIIIFNGPPGSGKDAACEILSEIGYKHLSFKEQLFKETFKYFGVSKDWFMRGYDERSQKEMAVPQLKVGDISVSRRDGMIHVSEKYIKPKYGKDYFGIKVAEQIKDPVNINYCMSDGGFIEELQPIINKFGTDEVVLVQLARDGCNFSNDSRRYLNCNLIDEVVINHPTENIGIHSIETNFDLGMVRIHNNGSLSDFKHAILNLHKKVNDVRKENKRSAGQENNSSGKSV